LCLYKGYSKSVELLISRNANIEFKTYQGCDLNWFASQSSNEDIGNILKNAIEKRTQKEKEKMKQEKESIKSFGNQQMQAFGSSRDDYVFQLEQQIAVLHQELTTLTAERDEQEKKS